MPIHVIVSQDPDALLKVLQSQYVGKHYKISGDSFLVVAPETSKDLSEKLGITQGVNGGGFVGHISGYFGRMAPDVWEWIRINWDKTQ